MKIFSSHKKALVISSDVLVSLGLIIITLYSIDVLDGAPLLVVAIARFVIGISLGKIMSQW